MTISRAGQLTLLRASYARLHTASGAGSTHAELGWAVAATPQWCRKATLGVARVVSRWAAGA